MTKFSNLKTRLGNVRSKLSHLALIPAVALMSSPVFAALPTTAPTPPTGTTGIGGGTPGATDFLGMSGLYFKYAVIILGTILCGWGLIQVIGGGLAKWKAYSAGRADISDLKEYFIMGSIFSAILVALATYAISITA